MKVTIERMIRDLVAHGFIHGWMGDKSEDSVIQPEIELWARYANHGISMNHILLLDIHSCNLNIYCGWSDQEVDELLAIFGTTKSELDQILRGE